MSTKSIIQPLRWQFPGTLTQAVQAALQDWQTNRKMARIWSGDKSLWTNDDEDKWLGWLRVIEEQRANLPQLLEAATDAANAGF
ncbi:MAG TPA: hypothetical protein VE133_17260, partial [Candidatus Sulfotelmatobacter sp.]|nr:hypothetical protein [Candidatus Sulfotelmatobacter sp.]